MFSNFHLDAYATVFFRFLENILFFSGSQAIFCGRSGRGGTLILFDVGEGSLWYVRGYVQMQNDLICV